MKYKMTVFLGSLVLVIGIVGFFLGLLPDPPRPQVLGVQNEEHWLLLHRKSNSEMLYYGVPGEVEQSTLVRTFQVKTGTPGVRPTPLPKLLGREYWLITRKYETKDDFETAPYFLELNIPISEIEPYGPTPYLECHGQCNWVLPGVFGLHGIAGDIARLSEDNPGSSGCIRHKDEDITYLYNILEPEEKNVRYYVEDI